MKDGREDGIQSLSNQTAIKQHSIMAAHQSRMTSFEKQIEKYLRGASDLSSGELKEAILEIANKVFSRKSKSDGPKKPANAYILFTNENRAAIVQELFDENGEKPKASQVTKRAGEKWKALSKEEQAPYVEKRAALMAEFEAENPELVSARSSTPKSAFEFDKTNPIELEVPSGWSKALRGKYLWRNAAGMKAGVGKFSTLAEAIAASDKLGSESGGVTLTARGYFVRKSNDPVTEKIAEKRENTYSWIKEEFVVPDVGGSKKKPKKKTKKVKKAELVQAPLKKPLVPYEDTDNESDDEEFSTPPSSP